MRYILYEADASARNNIHDFEYLYEYSRIQKQRQDVKSTRSYDRNSHTKQTIKEHANNSDDDDDVLIELY